MSGVAGMGIAQCASRDPRTGIRCERHISHDSLHEAGSLWWETCLAQNPNRATGPGSTCDQPKGHDSKHKSSTDVWKQVRSLISDKMLQNPVLYTQVTPPTEEAQRQHYERMHKLFTAGVITGKGMASILADDPYARVNLPSPGDVDQVIAGMIADSQTNTQQAEPAPPPAKERFEETNEEFRQRRRKRNREGITGQTLLGKDGKLTINGVEYAVGYDSAEYVACPDCDGGPAEDGTYCGACGGEGTLPTSQVIVGGDGSRMSHHTLAKFISDQRKLNLLNTEATIRTEGEPLTSEKLEQALRELKAMQGVNARYRTAEELKTLGLPSPYGQKQLIKAIEAFGAAGAAGEALGEALRKQAQQMIDALEATKLNVPPARYTPGLTSLPLTRQGAAVLTTPAAPLLSKDVEPEPVEGWGSITVPGLGTLPIESAPMPCAHCKGRKQVGFLWRKPCPACKGTGLA